MAHAAGFIALACLAGAACRPAQIVQPENGTASDCLEALTVKFDANQFAPGSFRATLNAVDITSLFEPEPAPGGTSSARIVAAAPLGTSRVGRLVGKPGVALDNPYNMYALTVNASCKGGTFYCVTEDRRDFSLNSFRLDNDVSVRLPGPFHPEASGHIIGMIQPAVRPTKNTPVELRPSNTLVSIDEMPPGAAKTLTIYAAVGFIPYKITGVSAGDFDIAVTPPTGCLSVKYHGKVYY